jgi:hypothetical protein
VTGSINLQRFRRAIAEGQTLEASCEISGLSLEEGRLTLAADAADPPPAETTPQVSPRKETDMARGAAKTKPIDGEEVKPDADLAARLYQEDIRPAQSKVSEHSQEMSTAYKKIKKEGHIPSWAAKLAFKLKEMEEAKRDHGLRGLFALLDKFNMMPRNDLVDAAQGKGTVGQRPKPNLVAVPKGPADDSDLSGDADEKSAVQKAVDSDDEFFESAKGEASE